MEKRKQIENEDRANGKKGGVTEGKNGTEFGKGRAEEFADEGKRLIDKQTAAHQEK